MHVRCKVIRAICENNNFYIYGCIPIGNYTDLVIHPKYKTFSIKGELGYVVKGQEYEFVLKEIQDSYGISYEVESCPTIEQLDFTNLSYDESYNILYPNITTSRQAKTLLKEYPNFIQLVMENKDDEINTDKLFNIGEFRMKVYKRELRHKYKYYRMISQLKDFNLTVDECKILEQIYKNYDEIKEKLETVPYKVLCGQLRRNFQQVDKLIIELFPELVHTEQRTEYLCLWALSQIELDGHTRTNASNMAKTCYEYAPECIDLIKETCLNSQLIHYEADTNNISNSQLYLAESYISDWIKEKLQNPIKWDIDWKKYQKTDEYEMTDEQLNLLKLSCENSIAILGGSAGCVDQDTEFFNGKEWKKISEWDNDLVLQYNEDGSSNLVNPIKYIKEKSDFLWHFETKYGINQTLCDNHRIIYWTQKGIKKETNIKNIIDSQNNNGWTGKFKTSFNYSGKGIDLTNDEIRLMCAVICDGHFHNLKSSRCRMNLKKDRKKERIRELLKKANVEFEEKKWSPKDKQYLNFVFYAPRITKEFDEFWYNCSTEQLKIICDEVLFWDGCVTKNRKSFSTISKKTADFIQFAFSANGNRASIYINNRVGRKHVTNNKEYVKKSCEYVVIISNNPFVGICCDNRKDHKKTQFEKIKTVDGYKYCFKIDSGMLVLRRNNNIFITGNCGKSTAVKALTNMLEDNNISYTMLTPTGISAKVLNQATHRPTSTIHRKICGDNMIDSSVCLIDEFSMVAVDLFYLLLQKLSSYTKLILVCDEAQLPSISAGNVLQNIIDSHLIPMTRLTKIFRYGVGALTTVATDIRNGKPYIGYNNEPCFQNSEDSKDYKFIPIDENPLEQILNIYRKLTNKYSKNDIMILSPFNVNSFGSYAINQAIQDEYNPLQPNQNQASRKIGQTTINFRVGDKVLNTKNNYTPTTYDMYLAEKNIKNDNYDDKQEFVENNCQIVNGDIGYIKSIEDDGAVIVQFDNDLIVYDKNHYKELILSDCISVFKSQGTQAKVIINITHPHHSKLLSRELLYVANTRAQELIIEIGDMKTINNALKKVVVKNRNTWLKEMLLKYEN